jgi:hypothetical protein
MSLADHVSLTITQDSVGVARAGFGVPLILSHNAAFGERLRAYTDLAGIAADGFALTSPEYLAASAMFAQAPRPEKVKIGRAALQPTQVYEVDVLTPKDDHIYQLSLSGEGVTPEVVSFTSDGSATANEIVTGLMGLVNAVVGKNFTATLSVDTLVITGDTAGDWFSVEVLDVTDLENNQVHVDPGVATDLAAIQLFDDDWYCLYTFYNSEPYAIAAAAWINGQKKIYVADSCESQAITTAAGNGDLIDTIATNNYARVAGMYHPNPGSFAAAAWMGDMLPREPGSATWKFKGLSGVAAVLMTATQRGNLVAKNGNSFETVAGLDITFEGTTGDGDFLDIQRGLDWLEDDMTKTVFETLAGAPKVPFTDRGVALLEGAMRASLKRAVDRQILAESPEPQVTVPKVAGVSAGNKTARILPDMKFSGTLSGAIHKVILTGVVSV